MAETLLDVRHEPKARAYELVQSAFDQVMGDTDDAVTALATVSALLHHGFGFLWTGFYRVVAPDLLRVGPYQGTLGCLDIRFAGLERLVTWFAHALSSRDSHRANRPLRE